MRSAHSKEGARYLTTRVDTYRIDAVRALRIRVESSDGSVGGAHEAVLREACTDVGSYDLAARVDACRISEVDACVERSDGSVGSAHKAVLHEASVHIRSRDRATGVDACRKGTGPAG